MINMIDQLNRYLSHGDYFLPNYLDEIHDILNYLSKDKATAAELRNYAKRGLSILKPCKKWADELHEMIN